MAELALTGFVGEQSHGVGAAGGGVNVGVATFVGETEGVASVGLGATGVDGVATLVDGSEGVATVVGRSCSPDAPPARTSAALKPTATSVRMPAAPAARRPPSHSDRTDSLFPRA